MSQTEFKSADVLGDPLVKAGGAVALIFILLLIVIELTRDESARAGVGGAGKPAITSTVPTTQ